MNRLSVKVLLGLVVLALVAVAIPTSVVHSVVTTAQATTLTDTRLRSGPGLGYTEINVIPPQTTVPILGRTANMLWLNVEYPTGSTGWIAEWIVTVNGDLAGVPVVGASAPLGPTPAPGATSAPSEPTPTPDPAQVQAVTLTDVNLRPEPGTSQAPLTIIPTGKLLQVSGRNKDSSWIFVRYQDLRGWVSFSLVTLISGKLSNLPVVDLNGGVIDDAPKSPTVPPKITPIETGKAPTVKITGIGQHTRDIFKRGQALGNYPHRFIKVGDSEMALPQTLTGFDANYYNLGEWNNLEDAVQYFHGSFQRLGEAAQAGQTITVLLDPFWADPNLCLPGENKLECEYRRFKPSVALILLRIHGNYDDWLGLYRTDMERVIKTSLDHGVIPVITLQFKFRDNPTAADEMNLTLRQLGDQYQVPVWDLWSSTVSLPDNGVDVTNHLTVSPDNNFDFSKPENMYYGKVVHNLEALQILDMLLHQVILQK